MQAGQSAISSNADKSEHSLQGRPTEDPLRDKACHVDLAPARKLLGSLKKKKKKATENGCLKLCTLTRPTRTAEEIKRTTTTKKKKKKTLTTEL